MNEAIFIKLTQDKYKQYKGLNLIQAYQAFANSNDGKVWFNGNLVHRGMAQKQIDKFKNNGKVYFCDSKGLNGYNDIVYEANIKDIKSGIALKCPDKKYTPKEWSNLESNVWLLLADIKECKTLKARNFIVSSTKRKLAEIIQNSECHFCYIEKIDY